MLLAGVLTVLATETQGCEAGGGGGRGCVTKHEVRRAAVVLDYSSATEAKPKPKTKPQKERVKPDCTKANATFWKERLRPWRGKCRTDGKRAYYWDHTHNDLEVYDIKTRKHLGSAHPDTGEMIKGPNKIRRLRDRDC